MATRHQTDQHTSASSRSEANYYPPWKLLLKPLLSLCSQRPNELSKQQPCFKKQQSASSLLRPPCLPVQTSFKSYQMEKPIGFND